MTTPIDLDAFREFEVALASRNHPGIEFRQADAEKLPFEGGSFDAGPPMFRFSADAELSKLLACCDSMLWATGSRFLSW